MTDRAVRAAKPGDREVDLADGKVRGLKLRIKTSGAKSWTLRYRTPSGQRRVTLGQYPEVKLAEARRKALRILNAVADGRDPSEEKAADREALRMVDLLGVTDPGDDKMDSEPGWYLGTYVHTAGRLGKGKTPKSIRVDRGTICANLRSRPRFMRKRVDEVTVADLNRIKAGLGPGAWRNVRDVLRVCFNHAEEIGAIPPGSNPAKRVKASTSRKRERFLTPEERAELEEVLTRVAEMGPTPKDHPRNTPAGVSPHIVRAIRILLLTGMRRSEVVGLQWQWIDWRARAIRLPASKTGQRIVPLTPQAVRFLEAEKGKGARMGLVCATANGTPIQPDNINRAWRRIRTEAGLAGEGDGKEAVRLHDLRHSWASDAISAGVSLYVVGAALGHSQAQTTARYAHLHDTAVRDGLALAGEAIERASKGEK